MSFKGLNNCKILNMPGVWIGLRYTKLATHNSLIAFISNIAALGLIISIAMLVVVLSVMNGFERELTVRILGLVPQVSLSAKTWVDDWSTLQHKIEQQPHVVGAAPFIKVTGMAINNNQAEPVLLYGVDVAAEAKITLLDTFIDKPLTQIFAVDKPANQLVIGSSLAKKLELIVGSTVNILLLDSQQQVAITTYNSKIVSFTVGAIFHTGTEIDQRVAVISLPDAANLYGKDYGAQGFKVKVDNLFNAPEIASQLLNTLPNIDNAQSWLETHGNLYQAIATSKAIVGLLLLIVVAVAAFNVISSLVLIINEKRSDIAILRVQGMSTANIMTIFVIKGLAIGLRGIGFGIALGVLLTLVVGYIVQGIEYVFNVSFLKSDVYPVDYLPTEILVSDVLWITLMASLICLVTTLLPAWRASKIRPATALRHDV